MGAVRLYIVSLHLGPRSAANLRVQNWLGKDLHDNKSLSNTIPTRLIWHLTNYST